MSTQLTIYEYGQLKQEIKAKLQEVQNGFIEIGYKLKSVRDNRLYLQDGYSDIYEFATSEFGLKKSTVNKFIKINDVFSIGGNSPEIKKEFALLGSSKLQEMLTLSEDDRSLITENHTVVDIKELKKFNEDQEQLKPSPMETYMNPPEPMTVEEKYDEKKELLSETIKRMFENRKLEKTLNEILFIKDMNFEIQDIVESVLGNGQNMFRNGRIMLFLNTFENGIKYKIIGRNGKGHLSWESFIHLVMDTFSEYINFPNAWVSIYKEVIQEIDQLNKEKEIQKKKEFEKAKKQLKKPKNVTKPKEMDNTKNNTKKADSVSEILWHQEMYSQIEKMLSLPKNIESLEEHKKILETIVLLIRTNDNQEFLKI